MQLIEKNATQQRAKSREKGDGCRRVGPMRSAINKLRRCPAAVATLVGIASSALAMASPASPATGPGGLERAADGVTRTVEDFSGVDQLIVLLVTTLVVPLVVGVHYEAMRLLVKLMAGMQGLHRLIIVGVILGLVLAHLVEILMFALTYAILESIGGFGSIHGYILGSAEPGSQGGVDYIYFSATVYSTVGFGDLVPVGPMRLLAGVEALLGLMLIAWSASFTYLQMHSHWREAFDEHMAKRQ